MKKTFKNIFCLLLLCICVLTSTMPCEVSTYSTPSGASAETIEAAGPFIEGDNN